MGLFQPVNTQIRIRNKKTNPSVKSIHNRTEIFAPGVYFGCMEPKTQQELAEEIFHLQVGLSPANFQSYHRATMGTASVEDIRCLQDIVKRVKKQS